MSFFKFLYCIIYLLIWQSTAGQGRLNRALEELKHMSVGLLANFIIESPSVLRQGLFTLTLHILVPNIGV